MDTPHSYKTRCHPETYCAYRIDLQGNILVINRISYIYKKSIRQSSLLQVAICFIVDAKVLPFVFILELQAHNIFLNVQSQISSITIDVITDQSFGHKDDWQN